MAELGMLEEFTKKYIIQIPAYQRGYAWEKANWEDLKNDAAALSGAYNHYCGPIVYSTTDESVFLDGPVREELKIVHIEDGQQRITTIILAAWNLERAFNDRGDLDVLTDTIKRLKKSIVFYALRTGASDAQYDQPRLKSSNVTLNRFLEDLFSLRDPEPTSAPMSRLKNMAHRQYKDFMQLSPQALFVLSTRLFQGLKFVFIDLKSQNINSHVAFHTINSRGVPLREFDKVKNGVMHKAQENDPSGDLSKQVERVWFETISALDNAGLSQHEDDFLGYSFAIHFEKGSRPSTRYLAIEILKTFDQNSANALDVVHKIVDSWQAYIGAYNFISSPKKHQHYNPSPVNEPLNKYIDALRRLESLKLEEIAKPLLLVAEKHCTQSEKTELSILIEKFVFRVFGVAKKRTDFLRSQILNLAQELAHDRVSFHKVKITLIQWIQKHAPLQNAIDEMFDSDRLNYNNWEPNRLGYFLLEYEHFLMGYSGHPIIWKKQNHSIEHICPQQQSGSGTEYLRFEALHDEWKDAFENEQLVWKYNLHRLGNLCYTTQNSTLGNKPWSEKKTHYQNATATHGERELTSFVEDTWNPNAILKREAKLAQFFVQRWSIGLDIEAQTLLPKRFDQASIDRSLGQHVVVTMTLSSLNLENTLDPSEMPEDTGSTEE